MFAVNEGSSLTVQCSQLKNQIWKDFFQFWRQWSLQYVFIPPFYQHQFPWLSIDVRTDLQVPLLPASSGRWLIVSDSVTPQRRDVPSHTCFVRTTDIIQIRVPGRRMKAPHAHVVRRVVRIVGKKGCRDIIMYRILGFSSREACAFSNVRAQHCTGRGSFGLDSQF